MSSAAPFGSPTAKRATARRRNRSVMGLYRATRASEASRKSAELSSCRQWGRRAASAICSRAPLNPSNAKSTACGAGMSAGGTGRCDRSSWEPAASARALRLVPGVRGGIDRSRRARASRSRPVRRNGLPAASAVSYGKASEFSNSVTRGCPVQRDTGCPWVSRLWV